MTTPERIAELETEIVELRHRMNYEKDVELKDLQKALIDRLVARVIQLRVQQSFGKK